MGKPSVLQRSFIAIHDAVRIPDAARMPGPLLLLRSNEDYWFRGLGGAMCSPYFLLRLRWRTSCGILR